jgi:hypothetical protein
MRSYKIHFSYVTVFAEPKLRIMQRLNQLQNGSIDNIAHGNFRWFYN